jgi:hypothetical protein
MLSACVTATPNPTATDIPTEIPIQPTPDRPIFACDPTQLVKGLRRDRPYYEEMIITQNSFDEAFSMTAWFVDPALDPKASSADLKDQVSLARRHSAELAQDLVLAEPCILSTFNSLTMIAVDPLYYAWYEGAVSTLDMSLSEELSEEDWAALEERFDPGYERGERALEGDPPESPDGSCTWPEARVNLQDIFARARINVSFHYYIEDESSVWVQWDVPPVARNAQQISDSFFEPLTDIDASVSCLYPPFDTLWLIYVSESGDVLWVFAVDGDAVREEDHQDFLDNLELIYPAVE